jgi:transcriptional regulator with XRE-family HTH domain
MNLGKAIKLCRNQREMTQQVLADRAELSVSYLSLLEKNKRDPSLSTLEKISHALNVPFTILLFLASEKSELSGLDPALAEKIALTALQFIHAETDQETLL